VTDVATAPLQFQLIVEVKLPLLIEVGNAPEQPEFVKVDTTPATSVTVFGAPFAAKVADEVRYVPPEIVPLAHLEADSWFPFES